ncbi:MAG: hypothetical protein PHD81_03290 [Candidatus Nanoarchaeia archaeon]|nr:hypothetical protein [Candidatus Nanoarchaeia archaeon]MDD5588109.1 hypothetical protein [Candidatus Nanoarchaeia archaeon]
MAELAPDLNSKRRELDRDLEELKEAIKNLNFRKIESIMESANEKVNTLERYGIDVREEKAKLIAYLKEFTQLKEEEKQWPKLPSQY